MKMKRTFRTVLFLIGTLILLGVILYVNIRVSVSRDVNRYIYSSIDEVRKTEVAMILGAQVYPGNTPSLALSNRLDTGIALFNQRKTEKLLMSGDGRSIYYNEVRAMSAYAESREIPSSRIIEDNSGLRTYDSCLRAKKEYLLRDIVIVTQRDHLQRAVYTCRRLGIDAYGIEAAEYSVNRRTKLYWKNWAREQAALVLAWFDVYILQP